MIIQGITAALSVGMGCGTCCGSGVSAFLFGYLTTHAKTMKHSFRAFFCFYLGKILAVAGVCLASSLVGRRILDESGSIGGIDLHFWPDLCMIAMGIWFVYKWIREFRHHEITTISMAAYTFASLAFAIANAFRYRKYGSPAYSAAKAISLVSAVVSVLTLENAMLTAFGQDGSDLFRQIMLGATGAAVVCTVQGIAVYMIRNAGKKLKAIHNS